MNIEQDMDFELARLNKLARRLDALFTIPGTRVTVGLDNLLGLVPLVGDVLALIPSIWIVWKARDLGARPLTVLRMTGNLLLDLAIGSVPVIGDVFDVLYNANIRNVALLEAHLQKRMAMAPVAGPIYGQIQTGA